MAAGNTYTPIASGSLGSAAASYTFNSIPGTYTDLVLIASHINTSGIGGIHIRFNGDSSSNYSSTLLYGTGSAAGTSRYTNQSFTSIGYTTNSEYAVIKCQIQNYSNSTTYKSFLSRGGSSSYEEDTIAGLWRATPAAITSITLTSTGGNIGAGSTFTLYGIAAA